MRSKWYLEISIIDIIEKDIKLTAEQWAERKWVEEKAKKLAQSDGQKAHDKLLFATGLKSS